MNCPHGGPLAGKDEQSSAVTAAIPDLAMSTLLTPTQALLQRHLLRSPRLSSQGSPSERSRLSRVKWMPSRMVCAVSCFL